MFINRLFLCSFATWSLIALLVVLVLFIIERTMFLHSKKIKPQQFLEGIVSMIKSGRYNEALTVCESAPGVAALVIKTALALKKKPRGELIAAVENVALLEIPLLERRLNSIRLISKIAPIVGFIGVLQVLAKILSDIKYTTVYFSSSLAVNFLQKATALVAFSLLINIIGVLAYSFLYGRVRSLIHDMEWSANEIIELVNSESKDNAHDNF